MESESIAYVIAGICFGIILGWVIGTQQARRAGFAPAPTAATQPAAGSTAQQQAPRLDEGRVQVAQPRFSRATPRTSTQPYSSAMCTSMPSGGTMRIKWLEKALELDRKNADASTDLGVSYYYSNKPDEALAQFERSLKIRPTHTKTLLNKGIVLAFGKQDLKAAATEWQKVVELAPDSPEGQAARRALGGIASEHATRVRRRAIRDPGRPARGSPVDARLGFLAVGGWCDRNLRGHSGPIAAEASRPGRQARARSSMRDVGVAEQCEVPAGRVGDALLLLR